MASEDPLVLVTGISGYAASWVAFAALKAGYRVRGTVRSLSNKDKVKHLADLCPGSRHQVELVEADLLDAAPWKAAVAGVTFVLHVASPAPFEDPKDESTVIKPAVDGTLNVLKAAAAEPSVKRVVLTSSEVAIDKGHSDTSSPFSEEDWSEIDNRAKPVSAYVKSKTLAEKAAWSFVETIPQGRDFLAVLNPTWIVGPMLSQTQCLSSDVVLSFLTAAVPAVPKIALHFISVKDVAAAHVLAMTTPQAAGKRILLRAGDAYFPVMAEMLSKKFRPLGYKVPTRVAPTWFLQVGAIFDSTAKVAVREIKGQAKLRSNRAEEILGLKVDTDLASLVVALSKSVIAAGLIPDKSPGQEITKEVKATQLDMDVSRFALA